MVPTQNGGESVRCTLLAMSPWRVSDLLFNQIRKLSSSHSQKGGQLRRSAFVACCQKDGQVSIQYLSLSSQSRKELVLARRSASPPLEEAARTFGHCCFICSLLNKTPRGRGCLSSVKALSSKKTLCCAGRLSKGRSKFSGPLAGYSTNRLFFMRVGYATSFGGCPNEKSSIGQKGVCCHSLYCTLLRRGKSRTSLSRKWGGMRKVAL